MSDATNEERGPAVKLQRSLVVLAVAGAAAVPVL
jgi:hypothetical protein